MEIRSEVDGIELTMGDGLALVTLARPERRNAISLDMWRGLGELFARLGQDTAVRGIVVTGAGGNFSAGADISEFDRVRSDGDQATQYEIAVDACCDAIFGTPKPTVAAVSGFCMGGACHVAISCDFRFAAPGAVFAIPASRLSIVYGVSGTRKLLSLVGISNAKRILYSAQRFGAEEGQRMGFIDVVSADPQREAKTFLQTLARNAPLSISGAKTLLNALASGPGALEPAAAEEVIRRAVDSSDYRESVRAFSEKRSPLFRGC